jgi:hypothetical protein
MPVIGTVFGSVVRQYGNETTYVIGAASQPFAVAN